MKNRENNKEASSLWTRYLTGKLSDQEAYALEKRFSDQDMDIQAMAKTPLSTAEIEEDLDDIQQRWKNRQPHTTNKIQLLMSRAAAVLLLAFSIWAIYTYAQEQKSSELYASYFGKGTYLGVRGSDIEDAAFQHAFNTYEAQDYEESYALFQHLYESSPNNSDYLLYSALSALQLGNSTAAIPMLKQLLKLPISSEDIAATQWYLALAYLQNKELENCQQTLHWITENAPNSQWDALAQKLASELEL